EPQPEERGSRSGEPRPGGRGSRQAKHGCFARESRQGERGWPARHAAHPRERPARCAGPDRAAALTERKAIPAPDRARRPLEAMGFSDLAGNQKKAPPGRGFKNFFADISDGRLYPCRLCTLRTLGDFVLDTQAFLETAKALRIDRRIVHEDIGAAVLGRDES